MIHSTDL